MTERKALPARLAWAAGMGLLVFFALESVLARRIGPDLFLPLSEGLFLPWRLMRLVLCLACCGLLALTEKGRALGWAVDSACTHDRGRWAAAAAVTALFFLWALRVTVLTYMTIDDVSFLRAAAMVPEKGLDAVHNVLAHSAQENASSISPLLCAFIGLFYGLDPDGYWYLCYHLVILLLSLAVIGRCILVKTCLRGWPAWTGCAIHGLLCAGAFFYAFAKISFTVTPAAAGAAAAALMLCRHHETRRAGRVFSDVLSGALMVLCFLQRRATGYCLVCFWALAVAYQALRACLGGRDGLKKRLGALALCAVLTLGAAVGLLAAGDSIECDEHYREAEYYRSLVGDYLNAQVIYDQYEQVGVPQELAALLYGWFFMDRRVTTDMFRQVSDIYYAEQAAAPKTPLPARLAEIVGRLADCVGADPQMLCRTVAAAVLLLACFGALLRFGKRYWPELLCALCAAGGAAVLLLYLVRDGRFPLRVFLAVALPALVMLLLEALSVPEGGTAPAGGRRILSGVLAVLCAGTAALCCAWGAYTAPYASQALTHDQVMGTQRAIEDFTGSHPELTVLTNIYDTYDAVADPFHSAYTYPENLVLWGYIGTTAMDPEDRLYADAFFRDDVRFMTDRPSALLYLLQYLTLDFGPVQAAVTDTPAGGLTVCDMDQVLPEPGYTGWYEQNGMTYYFSDGQALTGTQVIDGRTYTFAPAGAQAKFTASTDGQLIYLTDAYSLLTGR